VRSRTSGYAGHDMMSFPRTPRMEVSCQAFLLLPAFSRHRRCSLLNTGCQNKPAHRITGPARISVLATPEGAQPKSPQRRGERSPPDALRRRSTITPRRWRRC